MKQIKLSQRLAVVADFVQPCAAAADVGTDHGYIPVYLAQNSIAQRIIATDINKGPLERAKESARIYGVADKIEFILTDGLRGLEAEEIDMVILAGMGGETMLSILEQAVWTRKSSVRCILQPQSKSDELTDWLACNGYMIMDARLVRDDGRIYIVMAVQAGDFKETPLKILFRQRDALLPDYLGTMIDKIQRAVEGLEKSAGDNAAVLRRHKDAFETLVKMKEEADRWSK